MKIKIIILMMLTIANLTSLAQTMEIEYDYDDAGNRIQRMYNVIPVNPARADL